MAQSSRRFAFMLSLGCLSGVAACQDPPKPSAPLGPPNGIVAPGQAPAFPGADGYGAHATGGRGGAVLHVTSLADSGPGTLRWALEQAGPRIVVFDVSGAIQLQSQILVRNGDLTLGGQTSPGEGITVQGSRIRLKAGNIIIRGMHFRPGDGPGMKPGDRDGLMIGTTEFPIENIMLDHNSFTWAIDENLDINGNVHNVTISNNIIAEGLSHSLHPKGEHSKGLLVSNWSGTDGGTDSNISILRNLIASNVQRNPEVRAGENIEIVNNFIYNFGLPRAVIWVGGGSEGTLKTSINVIGNVLRPGPGSPGHKVPIAIAAMADGSRIFLDDNFWTGLPGPPALRQDQSKLRWDVGGARYIVDKPVGGSGARVLRSAEVSAYVLAHAGTAPFSSNSVDARIIRETRAGAGKIIDSPREVGGLPNPFVGAAKHQIDSDGDGMPDWFELKNGLNPHRKDAATKTRTGGFTNIEVYINGLIPA